MDPWSKVWGLDLKERKPFYRTFKFNMEFVGWGGGDHSNRGSN